PRAPAVGTARGYRRLARSPCDPRERFRDPATMTKYERLKPPARGTRITGPGAVFSVPDDPIIPFIRGDGTGPDIWAASVRVFDAAVQKAYGGKKRVEWFEIYAGDLANEVYQQTV